MLSETIGSDADLAAVHRRVIDEVLADHAHFGSP
jgi:hypothetical protein